MTIPTSRFAPLAAALAMLSLLPATPASAAEIAEAVYQRINEDLAEDYLLPRYRRFAEAAEQLEKAARSFCDGKEQGEIDGVRSAFGNAMDAWMAVQHIGFGPAELFMRAYRIQFWPQARGKFAGAVRDLVVADDASVLAPENFRNASVAVQGLPAAEALLYLPDAELAASDDSAVSRCDLLEAVAANLAEMGQGLLEDWSGGAQPFIEILRNPDPDNGYFDSARDATTALFKSLYAGLELIHAAKLRPVLGASAAAGRPDLAESPLSRRSLRNTVLNLRSLREMYLGAGSAGFAEAVMAQGDTTLDDLLRKAFRMTIETAESVSDPLTEAVRSAEQRARIERLATQVQALKQIVKTRLADALDLGVGFNALDGD